MGSRKLHKLLLGTLTVAIVAMLALAGLTTWWEWQRRTARQRFARAMATVEVGMAKEQVLTILGKPDDIQTQDDPKGIYTVGTDEIWRYGADGHLTFPTLGCVYIDESGHVQYIFGGKGQPPSPWMFDEGTLRDLLQIIDQIGRAHV